jgi:hypothetical protein
MRMNTGLESSGGHISYLDPRKLWVVNFIQ